ncbi:MAG TPA: hypothetical protein VGD87_16075, partial [Archangium sp.]
SSTAMAQAISGTLAATYLDSTNRIPRVQVDVNLACSLTCDTSAPVKHFAIVAGIRSKYAAAPTESADYSAFLSTDLDLDGQASVTSTSFKPGQTVFLEATSVTCHCGNRNGEGGFINLTTPSFSIPALIGLESSVRVGSDVTFSAEADLRGAEQVELSVSGGGLTDSKTFGVADLNEQGYAVWPIRFTSAGTATVTATLRPSGVSSTATWQVMDRTSSAGGGSGSTGTGGGSGGGGTSEPMGCTVLGGPALVALALALLRRRP